MSTSRYCIIGAGAAGLATLDKFRRRGIAVDCFEASDRVGGHWHTDYEALHLITPRDSSGFDDYPMPKDYPLFPSRDQVRDYMLNFARDYNLYRYIRFNTTVVRVAPFGGTGEHGWRVDLETGESLKYEAVLIANGHLWDPAIPACANNFTGRSLHSVDYNNINDIDGERVLVVGAGNSGCDLAVDVAQSRLDPTVSIRSGQIFQPKTFFGRPRSELTWLKELPGEYQEIATHLLINASLGSYKNYPGLQKPANTDLEQQRPVVNSLLLYWIQHGRVQVRSGIESIDGHTVHFDDGTSQDFDTILWATGFHVTFPFLDETLLRRRNNVPLRSGGLTIPAGLERLFFIGLGAPRGPQWPAYSAQADMVIRMLRLLETGHTGINGFIQSDQGLDSRIDIVRRVWQEQMEATAQLIDELEYSGTPAKRQTAVVGV